MAIFQNRGGKLPQIYVTANIVDMEFATKLRCLIAQNGESQRLLADLLTDSGMETSKSSVHLWCSGKQYPDLREALWIANHYGVSLEYLGKPEITEPSHGITNEGERRVVSFLRLLAIQPEEAIRRLAASTETGQRERAEPMFASSADLSDVRAKEMKKAAKSTKTASGAKLGRNHKGSNSSGSPISS